MKDESKEISKRKQHKNKVSAHVFPSVRNKFYDIDKIAYHPRWIFIGVQKCWGKWENKQIGIR